MEFLRGHFRSCVSDDNSIRRQQIVSILLLSLILDNAYQSEQGGELRQLIPGKEGTVFFFARSPDAPRTTMVTSFLSSWVLSLITGIIGKIRGLRRG